MCEYVGCLSVCLFILCLFTSYKSQELMTDGCHGNSSSWYRVLKDTQDKHRNTFQHEYLAPLRNNFTLVTTGHSPTHLLTHSLTHTHSLTYPPILTHSHTHTPTHLYSLTHTGLGPEKTSFFQALQIATKISRGTIEILVSGNSHYTSTCIVLVSNG